MDPSSELFYTPENILSDVLKLVGDEDYSFHSRGYYISQIQQALEELSFDTFFFKRTAHAEIGSDLMVSLPKDAFSVDQLYLFNGDHCNTDHAPVVYWKRNFFRDGSATYSRNDPSKNDPFHGRMNYGRNLRKPEGTHTIRHSDLYYANIQNGFIMFSDNCSMFGKVYIVYFGVGTDIGNEPIIPGFMRQAVHDYVAKKTLQTRLAQDDHNFKKWQIILQQVKADLMGTRTHEEGSWYKAEYRVKTMDSKEREDLKEYLARPNI